jgi:hypothetical protein
MFVFGETLKKAIAQIPESEQLRFYRIIVEYGIEGIEPDLSGLESAVWVQMKDMIDNTMPRKRGAPEGNANAVKNNSNNSERIDLFDSIETNKTIENQLIQSNQLKQFEKIENKIDNVNVNDNVNINVNENEKEKENENEDFSFSGFSEDFQIDPAPNPESNPAPAPDPHPPDRNAKTKEDATAVFQKARSLWNEREIPPECRDLIIPHSEYECLRAFQNYSWDDIENAIMNYDWHFKHRFDADWKPPPGYKSLFGFLKNGVPQYYKDEAFKKLFQEKKHGD